MTIEADTATAVSRVYTATDEPDEAELIRGWLLDPAQWRIVDGSLAVNRWMVTGFDADGAPVEAWNCQFKARLEKRTASTVEPLSVRDRRHGKHRCGKCGAWFNHHRVGTLFCSKQCCDTFKPHPSNEFGTVRHVIIPDTQVRPGVPTDHLMWTGRWVRDHCTGQRTRIVHVGEHWDMSSASTHDGPLSRERRRIRDDVEAGDRALEVLDESAGDDPLWDGHLLRGNHEHRIVCYVEEHPELEGWLGLENLRSSERWDVHDFLDVVDLDGVHYSHYFCQPNSGRPLAGNDISARIKQVGESFVMGHQQGLWLGHHFTSAGRQRCVVVAGAFYQHTESYNGPQGDPAHWRGIVVLNEVDPGRSLVLKRVRDRTDARRHGIRRQRRPVPPAHADR